MHTGEPDPLLLKVAEDIADGLPVDWAALAEQVEPSALQRMRELAALAGHFSAAQQIAAGEEPTRDRGSTATTLDSPPRQFAHLQILDELGRGSSGVVYRAFDPLLRRTVALKLCNPQGDRADDLLREAQQMARIDHPGVLKIHGAQIVDGHVGFWSDLVDGESIAHRLLRQRIIPAHESVLIALELCAALAAIHHIGLVHGDVKAQNVVRDHDGQHVLIDFGSARTMQERTHVSGTPLYLAPELLNGGQNTPADDLYSLGVLVFRMLSGRYPVESDSLAGLVEAHAEGRRLHLLDIQPHIDASLADVVERAVHPERSRRFQRAGEFAAALRQCLPGPAGMAATQRLDGTTERRPRTLPSTRRALIGAGVGALMVAALWLVWPMRPGQPIDAQLRLVRTTGGLEYPLLDGDRVSVGDVLSMQIELETPAHVYVMNEDASGAVFQLFPLPLGELTNPLPAGRRLRLPGRVAGRDQDWQVTSPGARERFYVLVSPNAVPDLHPASTGFELAEAGRPLDRSALYAAARVTRGVGGLSERVDAASSASFPVGDWLRDLAQQDPGIQIKRFELDNPTP